MVKMKFYWEGNDEKGSFIVTAPTTFECIQIAEDEIEGRGYTIIDCRFEGDDE